MDFGEGLRQQKIAPAQKNRWIFTSLFHFLSAPGGAWPALIKMEVKQVRPSRTSRPYLRLRVEPIFVFWYPRWIGAVATHVIYQDVNGEACHGQQFLVESGHMCAALHERTLRRPHVGASPLFGYIHIYVITDGQRRSRTREAPGSIRLTGCPPQT